MFSPKFDENKLLIYGKYYKYVYGRILFIIVVS
jgi:hypothetical protein